MHFILKPLNKIKFVVIDTFKRMRLLETYLFLSMLTLLICTNTVQTDGVNSNVLIPHLTINPNYVLIGLSVAAVIASIIINKKIKVNLPLVLLSVFVVYQLASVLLFTNVTKTLQYAGNYASIINACAVFYLFSQFEVDKTVLRRLFLFFTGAITLQLIVLLFFIKVPYSHSLFKYFITLPLGASNFVGCIIFPVIIYLACSTTPKHSLFYFAFAFALSLFIKNRSGFLVLFLFFVIYVFISKEIKDKTKAIIIPMWQSKKSRILLIVGCTLVLAVAIPLLLKFFMGYYHTITEPGFSILDKLTSKRTIVYEYMINNIIKSPVVGLSANYYALSHYAHNLVLELLCRDGIVGLALFVTTLVICFKNKVNKNSLAATLAVCCILLQSMLEVSVFRFAPDIFLWLLLGVVYQNKKHTN